MDTATSERFWRKVNRDGPVPVDRPDLGPCWLWTAGRTSRGYGAFSADGRQHLAHRVAYEEESGSIPDGLTIDHLCRVRHCVNPSHMEVVTRGVNVLRGVGPSAANARKDRCPRNHPYDLVSGGRRRCLACKRERYHERKAQSA